MLVYYFLFCVCINLLLIESIIFCLCVSVLCLFYVIVMRQPNVVTTSFCRIYEIIFKFIYGAWMTFSQIDLTISIKSAGPKGSCFLLRPCPLGSIFFNVLPNIRLLQVGVCSAPQVPGGFPVPWEEELVKWGWCLNSSSYIFWS